MIQETVTTAIMREAGKNLVNEVIDSTTGSNITLDQNPVLPSPSSDDSGNSNNGDNEGGGEESGDGDGGGNGDAGEDDSGDSEELKISSDFHLAYQIYLLV